MVELIIRIPRPKDVPELSFNLWVDDVTFYLNRGNGEDGDRVEGSSARDQAAVFPVPSR